MKKTSVLTSLSQFGSIESMKFRPTYTRHICYLRSPKFWQLIGEYVPKMATYMSFAVLYICIHIINTLTANPMEGTLIFKPLLGSVFFGLSMYSLSLSSYSLSQGKNWNPGNSGNAIQESEFMKQNSCFPQTRSSENS